LYPSWEHSQSVDKVEAAQRVDYSESVSTEKDNRPLAERKRDAPEELMEARKRLLHASLESLFLVLQDSKISRARKQKELLENHALFLRLFLELFEEHGIVEED
jgi:hypothetical protein